jgi:hypothetical protein
VREWEWEQDQELEEEALTSHPLKGQTIPAAAVAESTNRLFSVPFCGLLRQVTLTSPKHPKTKKNKQTNKQTNDSHNL